MTGIKYSCAQHRTRRGHVTAALCGSDFLPPALGARVCCGGNAAGSSFSRYLPALLVYRLSCLRTAKYKVLLLLNAKAAARAR